MKTIIFDIINTYNLSGYNIKRFINIIDNKKFIICINNCTVINGGRYVSIVFVEINGKEYHFGFKAEWDEKTSKYCIYTDKIYVYDNTHNINSDVANYHYAFVNTELIIGEITANMISAVVNNISKLEEMARIKK